MGPAGNRGSRYIHKDVIQPCSQQILCISHFLCEMRTKLLNTAKAGAILDMFLAPGNLCIKNSGVNSRTHTKRWDKEIHTLEPRY